MKAPSRNVSASLRGQNQDGSRSEEISVTQQRRGGPTMTVPGEGGVEFAPGTAKETGSRGARSACHYTAPMSRYGGAKP